MKARIRTCIAIAFILLLVGCSKEKPKVRVMNQRSDIVDVQLKRQSGNTYNINDVAGNSATGYIEVDVANFEVEAKPENVSGKATTFFTAEEDKSYTIVIPNTITPTVRVEQP